MGHTKTFDLPGGNEYASQGKQWDTGKMGETPAETVRHWETSEWVVSLRWA
jgi:hypothetical protein